MTAPNPNRPKYFISQHRSHWGIHETGEWFDDTNELSQSLGVSTHTIMYYAKHQKPWYGLHIFKIPKERICRYCKKPLTADNTWNPKSYFCKQCKVKRTKELRHKRPEAVAEWSRKGHLKKYKLTPATYAQMLIEQAGVCAACGHGEEGVIRRSGKVIKVKRLSVDHNHKTGEVRGLLCSKCNSILGLAGDEPGRLKKCIDYLEQKGG